MFSDAFYAVVLIACLDAHSFRQREAAHAALEQMGGAAYPAIVLARGRSAEQRMRLDRLREGIRFASYRRILNHFSELPWLDLLPDSWPDRCGVINRQLQCVYAEGPSPTTGLYPAYRDATRKYILCLIDSGWGEGDVMRLLLRMERRGANWSGAGVPPPE